MHARSFAKESEPLLDKLLQSLLKNTPIALVVIGAFLVLLGASGGFEKYGLKIDAVPWRVSLAVMGVVVASFGGFLALRGEVASDRGPAQLAKRWDLKIVSQRNGEQVDRHLWLRGTYSGVPDVGSVAIVEQSTVSKNWYFRKPPFFDEKKHEWFSDFLLGGAAGQDRILYVAVLGKAGRVLQEYYFAIEKRAPNAAWLDGIWLEEASPDIFRQDQIIVRRKT